MTVSTTTSRVRYEGDGATSVFPVPFKFVDNAHVKVTLRDAASQETPWSEGSQYALSGAGGDSGGTLTVLTEPVDHRPRSGEVLVIALELPFTQDKAFPLGGAFPTTQVEEGLDLAALRDAQLAAFDARAFSVPATDAQVGGLELPIDSLRAGRYLGFDAAGKPALLAGTAEAADVSDKTVLPSGAAAARSLADLFGLGALTAENVKLHGARGDLAELADGTVTDGSAVLSSAGVTFDSDDVGKAVWVEACSTAGKAISAIANGPADAAWQWDASAGTFVDLTDDLNDAGGADVEPFPATEAVGDVFYLGHIQTFDKVAFDIATQGVAGVVAWEYWNGSTWTALTVTDGTSGFTAAPGSHDLTFTPPGDWATTQLNSAINGRRLYYIRARLTTLYTTNPVLSQGVLDGGRIRITSPLHLVEPLQSVSIKGVAGTVEANGTWQVERIDNDVLDLIGPSFRNAYVSGGTIHGRLETTIAAVAGGDATLAAPAGASIAGSAAFGYGTDDTAAIQAALDTGKAVVVPDGNYLASALTISTDRQKLLGMGGRIVALPAALHSNDDALLLVEANFVEVAGLYLDNPTEQNTKAASWPDAVQAGIRIKGFQCNIHDNTVRRFQSGIQVVFDGAGGSFSGFEFSNNIIAHNMIWENLGAGSGRDQREGIQGEDRGDGITSWGAQTVIKGNIVHVKEGQDARIGIHVESLADRHDPVDFGAMYADRGAVIANNIVLGHDLDTRNGRWRRGIVSEAVKEVSITGNLVYGGGWWSIAVIIGGSDPEGKGNFSIVGNNIFWSRPAVDLAGDDWSPARAGIAVWGNTAGIIANVVVADNNIQNIGELGTGIRVTAFNANTKREQIRVIGNSVLQRDGGVFTNSFFNATQAGAQELIVASNIFKGYLVSGQAMLRVQDGFERLVINGNIVVFEGGPTGIFKCMQVDGGSGVITGNHFDGANDAVHLINMDRVVFSGNIIENTADDGLDMFGTDPFIVSDNIFQGIGGSYIVNGTPSATRIDADNVKN